MLKLVQVFHLTSLYWPDDGNDHDDANDDDSAVILWQLAGWYDRLTEKRKTYRDHYIKGTLNLCKTATLKKTKNWFSRPIIA